VAPATPLVTPFFRDLASARSTSQRTGARRRGSGCNCSQPRKTQRAARRRGDRIAKNYQKIKLKFEGDIGKSNKEILFIKSTKKISYKQSSALPTAKIYHFKFDNY